MRVIYLVYKWCWIISSDFHRQYASGEHSPLPAIFLFIVAMHDKHLVWRRTGERGNILHETHERKGESFKRDARGKGEIYCTRRTGERGNPTPTPQLVGLSMCV